MCHCVRIGVGGAKGLNAFSAAITFALAALSIVLAFAFLGWFPILMTLIYSFWGRS